MKMNSVVFDEALKKKVYFFKGNKRKELQRIKVGSIVVMEVENDQNEAMILQFRVTRDAHLGRWQRWIYGKLQDAPAGEYHQVEIRLHKNEPKSDTIAVFPQAPPSMINKLR